MQLVVYTPCLHKKNSISGHIWWIYQSPFKNYLQSTSLAAFVILLVQVVKKEQDKLAFSTEMVM